VILCPYIVHTKGEQMGKHSGKRHVAEQAGREGARKEGETPEETVAAFERCLGSAVIAVADKRLRGTQPYDMEPGNKGTVDDRGMRRSDAPNRRRA
jgi:hypothetical protein